MVQVKEMKQHVKTLKARNDEVTDNFKELKRQLKELKSKYDEVALFKLKCIACFV